MLGPVRVAASNCPAGTASFMPTAPLSYAQAVSESDHPASVQWRKEEIKLLLFAITGEKKLKFIIFMHAP